MRVTDVRSMRLVGPDPHGIGGVPRSVSFRIIRVTTDAGIDGLGECADFAGVREGLDEARAWLVGRDPLEIGPFRRALVHGALPARGDHPAPSIMSPTATSIPTLWAVAGIETALWDIAGKAAGLPVHALLGGAFRRDPRVYVDRSGVTRPGDLGAWRALGEAAVADGYDFLKVDLEQVAPELTDDPWNRALGSGQVERIADRIGALREAVGPNVEVALDGHMAFTAESAVRAARALEPLRLRWFEDPIPIASAMSLAQVRQQSAVPICAGEMFAAETFRAFLEAGALDILHPDILFAGGLAELRRIGDLAELWDRPLAIHNNGSALAVIASAHAAAASPTFLGLEYHFHDAPWVGQVVRREGVPFIAGGRLPLTDAPGLGVVLDREACAARLAPGESLA